MPQDPNRPGYVIFQSYYHMQRPALLLAKGQVWCGRCKSRDPVCGHPDMCDCPNLRGRREGASTCIHAQVITTAHDLHSLPPA